MNGFVVPKTRDPSRTLELLKALRIESLIDLDLEAQEKSDKYSKYDTKTSGNGQPTKLIPIKDMINGYGVNKPRVRHTESTKRMVVVEESELRLDLKDVVCDDDDGFSDVDLTTDRDEVDKAPRKESKGNKGIGQRIKRFMIKYLCSFYDYSM